MLITASSLLGYKVHAQDGEIGVVSECLFDGRSWRLRWLVIRTGHWLSQRQVLVHPSAVLRVDHDSASLQVALTIAQVKGSPDVTTDEPVSRQRETVLYDYYGWDPLWGTGLYDLDMLGGYIGPPRYFGASEMARAVDMAGRLEEGDPDLRSIAVVTGYHVHALDGTIGHVEAMLIDDAAFDIRYLVVDTSNWWFGRHVLVSPYAVKDISWSRHEISVDLSRAKVAASPAFDPAVGITEAAERALHLHYAWPGHAASWQDEPTAAALNDGA